MDKSVPDKQLQNLVSWILVEDEHDTPVVMITNTFKSILHKWNDLFEMYIEDAML